MQLFSTDPNWINPGEEEGVRKLERAGRVLAHLAGMPFFLSNDGAYLKGLNAWLRSLPLSGVGARNSWVAYARDVLVWWRHLESRGLASVWEATKDDYLAYHAARTRGADVISPATWNRSNQALESLYTWGQEHDYVERPPFSYRRVRSGFGAEDRRVIATTKPLPTRPIRFLTKEEFDLWLRQGMRLAGPDVPTNGYSVRLYRAIVYLMVTTAVRKNEALALLRYEPGMPDVGGRILIPAHLRKRETVDISPALAAPVRKEIADYIKLERPESVERGRDAMWGIRTPLFAIRGDEPGTFHLPSSDEVRPSSRISRMDRARLVIVTKQGTPVEPGLLFLASTNGRPMYQGSAVDKRFQAARKRLKDAGNDLAVTPHDLRHTYAVHRLNQLVQAYAGKLEIDRGGDFLTDIAATEPLRMLQDELGHQSFRSVLKYLRPDASRLRFDWQIEPWDPAGDLS